MRVLVTGASGHVASAVIPELVSAGHTVTGLARSDSSAAVVRSLGAEVYRGDLDDLKGLAAAAHRADGVIHLAFKHDMQQSGNLTEAVDADLRAIAAMSTPLIGTGKPFVGTNATGALALAGFDGQLTEHDTRPGGLRIDAENAVIALADDGVRSSVVRLPPAVHGDGRYGFVSDLIAIARATGVSGHAGEGDNRWPSTDVRDVGRLYRLALESAAAGTRVHAVAEEGITIREIAELIGRHLDVPVRAITSQELQQHFGHFSVFAELDNPTSSQITRDALGWTPTRPGLLADLAQDRDLNGRLNGQNSEAPTTSS
ncbi:SDR family oxidoreductase [Streptomyces sp. NPDC020719]|uniref:SDR family oxidoreductase n=1 Tax=Streptomyces sp. NPDC020719 TaxID=3154896 RepID=UPI0033CB3F06